MCGIVAIYNLEGKQVLEEDIRQMASVLVHRGPDEAGYAMLNEGTLGFGHLRLSIIDLSTGQQPIYNEDLSICLIYNGEIYDYKALRLNLEHLGHRFRTTSDSEVIVHLYEEYGLKFVDKINGEFAIILWDQNKRRLIAVRDRVGIKPLFYYQSNEEVIFASEAKAILSLPRTPHAFSKEYLTGTFFGTFTDQCCAFENIRVLKPGHFLIIENGQPFAETRYWEMKYQPDYGMTKAQAKDELRHLFLNAVKKRMVADVEVGTYLSGGLDSTLICNAMSKYTKNFKAFNIGFRGSEYDESLIAAKVAEHYGARFETIDCTMDIIAENFEKAVYYIEMPLSNPNSVAKYLLSGLVNSQGYKVVITGEGSDEIFGGYSYFKLEKLWQMIRSGDEEEKKKALKLYKKFREMEKKYTGMFWDSDIDWKRKDHPLGYPSYLLLRSEIAKGKSKNVLNQENFVYTPQHNPADYLLNNYDAKELFHLHPFNATRKLTFGQLISYIIPALEDRVAMGHSVECRPPFLDRDVLDFSGKVPPEYFIDIDNLREKAIIREAFLEDLPDFFKKIHKHPFLSPSWHDFSKTKKGGELFRDFMTVDHIKKVGIFDVSFFKLMNRVWTVWPSAGVVRRIDIMMGSMLGVHLLHHYLIENRPSGISDLKMMNRSPEVFRNSPEFERVINEKIGAAG